MVQLWSCSALCSLKDCHRTSVPTQAGHGAANLLAKCIILYQASIISITVILLMDKIRTGLEIEFKIVLNLNLRPWQYHVGIFPPNMSKIWILVCGGWFLLWLTSFDWDLSLALLHFSSPAGFSALGGQFLLDPERLCSLKMIESHITQEHRRAPAVSRNWFRRLEQTILFGILANYPNGPHKQMGSTL